MDDLFTSIENWKEKNISMALATVISTWGSSPRGVGSKMVVNADGDMAGSVSGGCVESAVVEAGMSVCKNSQCIRLEFGVSDEVAWDIGLACGGQIEVFIQPLNHGVFHSLKSRWEEDIPTLRAFAIQSPDEILGKELILSDGGGFFPSQLKDYVISIEHLGRDVLDAGVSAAVALVAFCDSAACSSVIVFAQI